MNLPIPISITPKRKLNVFVSSACGDGKERYNEVRQQIKNCIESTGIADVYLFEDAPASTLTAGQAYLNELKDSDVPEVTIKTPCILLDTRCFYWRTAVLRSSERKLNPNL